MIDGNTALELSTPDLKTLSGGRKHVFDLMSQGGCWTLFELQQILFDRHNVYYSETCISARIRDLRKHEYGGHTVERQARSGRTYEYRLINAEVTNDDSTQTQMVNCK